MLSAISFMFSMSLAFVTWIILCYFKAIEDQHLDWLTGKLILDKNLNEFVPQACPPELNFGVYVDFLWIFACIYALARIMDMTERWITKRMQTKLALIEASNDISKLEHEAELKQSEVERQRLAVQNESLLQRIQDLEDTLTVVKQGSSIRTDDDDEEQEFSCDTVDKRHSECFSLPNNRNAKIYITNRHIHVTRQVFVNEGVINVSAHKPCEMPFDKASEFAQIWWKYLRMQKFAIKQPTDETVQLDGVEPLVISTEELQKIQGIC